MRGYGHFIGGRFVKGEAGALTDIHLTAGRCPPALRHG
jgi:hypothetical protein